ncbi:class I glutamine amidotransferase-like protein [Epithele typhae]|uniref:class I glutamine amidotransferase-like protein n=1 Tax=Epithele typhae TaxID=378194 RepID=UPI002008235C|nr:class I glutamine amidotransferase-like protein [Epithele typhae]KAH9926615.1 class I glutamine amidotransferase-like protein [Epithele typhae]
MFVFSRLRAATICAALLSVASPIRAQDTNTTTPSHIGILLFPSFEPTDVFGPVEVFQALGRGHTHISLSLISNSFDDTLAPVSTAPPADRNALNSTAYVAVVPTHTLAAPPPDLDVLFVPGGIGTRLSGLEPTIAYINATYPALHSLVGVCTGASLLARAGVLDGRRATTNKHSWHSMIPYGPKTDWQQYARVVRDGNVWTAGGVSAATDAALSFVAATWGEGVARTVANEIEYEWRNDPDFDVFGWVWP